MKRSMTRVAVATVVVGVVTCAHDAIAGSWRFSPSVDGGPHLFVYEHDDSDYSHLSNTNPPAPHPRNVPFSVTIHNPTNTPIAYTMNDQREPQLPRLQPGHTVKWTVMGSNENPAVFTVSFDNGQNRTTKYRIPNNSNHVFEWRNNVLDLYRRLPTGDAKRGRSGLKVDGPEGRAIRKAAAGTAHGERDRARVAERAWVLSGVR